MKKKKTNEGVFDAADKFVAKFFDGLKKNTANQIIKKAQNNKLPPEALKAMKDMEDRSKYLKKVLREL